MARAPRHAVTDHCDGELFFNPTGPSARSFFDLPKWWWQQARGQATPWPRRVPAPQLSAAPVPPAAGEVRVTFIGHATLLLQVAGVTILTDPVFGSRAGPLGIFGPKRVRPPALALAQLPPVDLVVVSHNHYDHLDLASLRWLARHRRPALVAPLALGRWLAERGVPGAVELDWWQSAEVAGVRVTATPAQHWSSRSPWDRCATLWAGYRFDLAGGSITFAGDSGWGPHFAAIGARLGPTDLALLPIGAYEPRWFMEPVHMNPDEAVRAHRAVGARRSIGMHYGTFRLTDEGFDAPVRDLAVARRAHGLGDDEFLTLDTDPVWTGRLAGA